ncbi:MAG: hypothetical protein U9R36_03275, partial [Elusimicrobiota bacterium]|nr:hypothetical protein [Elusimicrobiota bacterium]
MKYFKLKFYIILLTVSALNPVRGYAQFEDTGAGARAAGMGNAYIAEASGPETIYYNPAGLANSDTYQLSSSYSRLFWGLTDNSRLGKGYLGYMLPVNEKFSAGFAWQHFMLDSFYSEDTFYFSGAYRLSGKIDAGLNLKILGKKYASTDFTRNSVDLNTGVKIAQTNPVFEDGYSKFAFTPDIGLLYHINYAHRAGLTVKNLTGPDMA